MLPIRKWTDGRIESDRQEAIDEFRTKRMAESADRYNGSYDEWAEAVHSVFDLTENLRDLRLNAEVIVSDARLFYVFRYLAAPVISEDDLKTLSAVESVAPTRLCGDSAMLDAVVETVESGLDEKRFPWLNREDRVPTEIEVAVGANATAVLLANQRAKTDRRTDAKDEQEAATAEALAAAGYLKVARRKIKSLADAPAPGEFCAETTIGTRQADFVVRLHDGRILAIDCKVSNSLVNSIKRLNNDNAAKAVKWIGLDGFAESAIIPVSVIAGVFYHHHLVDYQNGGNVIFWSHSLSELQVWLDDVKRLVEVE